MKSVNIDKVSKAWSSPPVVVIGAGASGLTAIKCCLEGGLNVVCFEKTDYIGGLWSYREEVVEGVASVMKTTVINSSKEMSAYSDFPPPPEFANFMHNRDQAKYFDMYADAFDLRRYIFHYYVVDKIMQNDDFEATGQWTVTVTNTETRIQSSIVAAAVMVCSGHHSYPHIPAFPGLNQFKGTVIHTHSYKDQKPFEDKRVVIIGVGNSGGDIAVELGRASSKVYLSTRRGTWIINRVGIKGFPVDYQMLRRCFMGPNSYVPHSVVTFLAELLHQHRFDHELYNLKPNHRFFSQHPMVNDSLPNSIMSGIVTIKNDIHYFTEDGVVFKGEEDKVYPVDVVIVATGYDIQYPFVDSKILSVNDNVINLYKYIFPPKVQPPTLSIIGLIQPFGSIVPISELQSRWVVSVLKNQTKLPSLREMEKDIHMLRTELEKRYVNTRRHTVQVDYMTYMDDIGQHLGVVPNLKKMFIMDPVLWYHCYCGANLPYQYRLTGPHAWSGAREAIIKCKERIAAPLQTRPKVIDFETGCFNNNAVGNGHTKPKIAMIKWKLSSSKLMQFIITYCAPVLFLTIMYFIFHK